MNTPFKMTPSEEGKSASAPAHQVVYDRLRALILFGDLKPGQPITINGLVEQLSVGMTPVREAIRRLTAEGALEFMGNRRVIVPQLSDANVDELLLARLALEPELTRRATKKVTDEDLTQLKTIDATLDASIQSGNIGAYLQHNYRFHAHIYAMAEAPILASVTDGLWLRFGPSLRIVFTSLQIEDEQDMHKTMLRAMQAGDGDAAAEAMAADVRQGMTHLQSAILARGDG